MIAIGHHNDPQRHDTSRKKLDLILSGIILQIKPNGATAMAMKGL
jgi:hypothetical protein